MNSPTSPTISRMAAIVLCGGRSTRMGRDKALLQFQGEPMVARCSRRLASAAAPVVVVAAPGQQLPTLPNGVRIVRDEKPHPGPLAGLLAGLKAIAPSSDNARADLFVALCSCDLPFPDVQVLQRMADQLAKTDCDRDAHVLRYRARLQPQHSIWRMSAVDRIQAAFEQGQRSLKSVLLPQRTLISPAEAFEDIATPHRFLTDVNRPADLAKAENGARADEQDHDAGPKCSES